MRQTNKNACLRVLLFLVLILCVISSCGRKSSSDIIKVEFGNPFENFTSLIESVEYIPLETDSLHILGFSRNLIIDEDRYIVIDKRNSRIYSYDISGKFISEIGKKGNGPGEYLGIISVQLYQDSLIVYSMPDKEISYDRQGGAKEKRMGIEIGQSAFKTRDGTLNYYGYGINLPYRLSLIKDGKEIEKFLYSDYNSKVFSVDGRYPIFTSDGENVFLRDSYNSNILQYKGNEVSDFLCFDLGRYNIPDKYFKFDDPSQAFSYLQTIEAEDFSFFCKDGNTCIVGLYGYTTVIGRYDCGLYHNSKWHWFSYGNSYRDSFFKEFMTLHNGFIYFLIPANLVADIPEQIMLLATNPDAIKDLKEDDNYVITKIKLK